MGITINEFLDWNSHTIKISNKLSRAIGIMHKLRKIIPIQILKLMYSCIILPHLYFGITAWGFTCRRVYGLQKKAIRIITKSKFNAHRTVISRIVTFESESHISIAVQCLKPYYNITNGRTPAFFLSMFVLNDTVHSYQTRHRYDIHIPLTNTTCAQNCIRQYVPRLLTSMPVLVISKVNTHSYIGFSNYVKQHLIGLYRYECLIPNCYICDQR